MYLFHLIPELPFISISINYLIPLQTFFELNFIAQILLLYIYSEKYEINLLNETIDIRHEICDVLN